MRKFTDKKTTMITESTKAPVERSEKMIDNLISMLTLEINGSSESDVINVEYDIKPNDKFYEGIKNYINNSYHAEKLELLEKAKLNYFNNNIDWIDDEINIIKESLNKNK